MDQATEQLVGALKQAIQAEGDGYHFYTTASRTTTDPRGRTLLEVLAQEELDHLAFLRAHHASLLATGQLSGSARLGARRELGETSPIFSPELKSRIQEAGYEMSVLSIAIQLERSSMEFYRGQAEAATDERVKAFFGELADWETGHYRALLQQQDELAADFWEAGGFSPF